MKPDKIRYFACGEYGEKETKRPHYHAIIFGYWPKDIKKYKTSEQNTLYKSEKLNKIWKKGYCIVGSVTYESASYTASYVTKKITGDRAAKHYNGKQPEFALMSNQPGLGNAFYHRYKKEIWATNTVIQKGKPQPPPSYYNRLLKEQDPKKHEDLKKKFPQTKPKWFTEWEPLETQKKKQKYRSNYTKAQQKWFKKSLL